MPDATDTPLLPVRAAVRPATDLPLPREHVEECHRKGEDEILRRAWRDGPDALTLPERRSRLCADTGFIAESVATLLLDDVGLDVFAQIVTLGVHGVDLLALSPKGTVLALEVKGRSAPARFPVSAEARSGRSASSG